MTIRDDVKEAHDLLVHLAHGGRLDSLAPAAYAQMTALVERLEAHAADDESTLTSIVFATGERLGIAPADLSPTEVLTRIEAMHVALRDGVVHLVQHQANHKIPMPIVFIDDLLDDPVAAMERVRS